MKLPRDKNLPSGSFFDNKNKYWTFRHYPKRITIIRRSHAFFKATNDVPKNVQLWQVYRTRIFDQAVWKLSVKYYRGLRSCYADRCLNLAEKIGVSMMRIIGMIKENDSARYMAHSGESLYEFSFIYLYSSKFSLDFCSKCAALIFWDWGIAEKTFIIM